MPASQRPGLLLAMDPARTRHVLGAAERERLAGLCRLLAPEPLQELASPQARALLTETTILLTGWGAPRIDGSAVAAAPGLRLIAHAAGTVKALLGPEVFARGIQVTHAADANALPVAEFTLAAILFANKRVLRFQEIYRRERSAPAVAALARSPIGNLGKVVGIIGASRIGRRVIELLRPFDLEVLLHDPFLAPEAALALGARPMPLDDLLRAADIVSLHAPALPATRHMLDARRLALLQDGATFINTSRPSLVDQEALVAELASGRIDAVLDVTDPEPLPADSPLYELPNVLLTPHVAGALGLECQRLGRMVVDDIERFLTGQPMRHAVDPTTLDRSA